MLRLKNITKYYTDKFERVKVLKDINIAFRKKELVAIIGPSGSGKSTLLNIIGLLDDEYEGKIYLNGKNISLYKNYLNDKLLRNSFGFVFQNYNLIEDYTVYKNIDISLSIKGIKNRKKLIIKALKNCKLLHLKDKKVSYLSGGEKQRVAIARALASSPSIVLLDEPTGALDSVTSKSIMKFIKEKFSNELIIMVTHDKKLAKEFADRIIIINDGNILYDSKPYYDNKTSKLMIKKNKMNILDNLRYSFFNLKRKKFRNILVLIAIIISITTISFVMFLTDSFKNRIDVYSKDVLNNYPIVIMVDKKNKIVKNKINRYSYTENLYLDDYFVENFKLFARDNNIRYLIKYNSSFHIYIKTIENSIKLDSYLDDKYLDENYKLLKGGYPKNNNEVLLKIDDYKIDSKIFELFDIKKDAINYEELINKEIKVYYETNEKKFKICGVVMSKNNELFDSLLNDDSDFLYNGKFNIKNDKGYAIYVYDKKDLLPIFLENYDNIKYQDLSKQLQKYLINMIKGVKQVFLIFGFISILIALLLIIVMTYTSGIERKKEIGILKSFGARKRDIVILFINEILILSLIGSLISLILIILCVPVINNFLYKITDLQKVVRLSSKVILYTVLVSIFTGVLGSLFPAIKNGNKSTINCFK